jgi:DNA-binding PadR family transcriptional regulator
MVEGGEIGKLWSLPRPRVYYAIEALTRLGFARASRTVASREGPDRTVLQITPSGRQALTGWLDAPVEHVRDVR